MYPKNFQVNQHVQEEHPLYIKAAFLLHIQDLVLISYQLGLQFGPAAPAIAELSKRLFLMNMAKLLYRMHSHRVIYIQRNYYIHIVSTCECTNGVWKW